MTALVRDRTGFAIDHVRLRYLDYAPGHRFLARWRGQIEGQTREFVVSYGWQPGGEVRVDWFPDDPGLAALPDLTGELLAWVPFQRAVVRGVESVCKVYSDRRELERCVDALRLLDGVVAHPAVRRVDRDRHVVELDLVPGRGLGGSDALDAAPAAGQILRRLQQSDVGPAATLGARDLMAQCRPVVELVAHARPDLAERARDALGELGARRPADGHAVVCHGDFNVGQLVAGTGSVPVVVDWDTLCTAAAALDVAAWAANLVSGRPDDEARAQAALDRLLAGYGPAPEALDWYLSATCLRRLDRAVRRAKHDWPTRTERILEASRNFLD